MQRWLLSTRVGPMLGLVGSILTLVFFFLPPEVGTNEWSAITGFGAIEPMVVLVLLAALAVPGLSVAALFRPSSPVSGFLGFLAASVGLLAQSYFVLNSFMDTGLTLANPPRLFSFLTSLDWGNSGFLFLLSGFLFSAGAMAFTALQAGVIPDRDSLIVPETEQPFGETRASEREGRRPSNQEEADKQEHVWSIGRRHILAMIVGVLLCSVLSNLYIVWYGPEEDTIIGVFPVIVLVLFFGIVYGPWVGLVVGGIGTFLNNAIGILAHVSYWTLSNYSLLNGVPLNISHPYNHWLLVVENALIGLIAGFPLFGAAGRGRAVRSLLTALLRSAFALVVAPFVIAVSYNVVIAISYNLGGLKDMAIGIQSGLTYETIPALLVVVLFLPLLLLLVPTRTIRTAQATL